GLAWLGEQQVESFKHRRGDDQRRGNQGEYKQVEADRAPFTLAGVPALTGADVSLPRQMLPALLVQFGFIQELPLELSEALAHLHGHRRPRLPPGGWRAPIGRGRVESGAGCAPNPARGAGNVAYSAFRGPAGRRSPTGLADRLTRVDPDEVQV